MGPLQEPREEEALSPVRAEFFPYGPDVTRRVREWAEERGVRVLATIPVYYERGVDDGSRRQSRA